MKQSKFVISTRRDTILTYLHNHGTAKVDELSVLCGVSPLTIRRDLDALEQSNMVIRNFWRRPADASFGRYHPL